MLLALPELIQRYGMSITGVLHAGAHAGQEAELYHRCGIPRVLWIEANPDLMAALDARVRPLGHVTVCACAGAREGDEVVLNISESPDGANQGQSSSVLRLGTHAIVHPEVRYVGRRTLRTRTIASILERHWHWREPANFMNLDVQGYELECLKGAEPALERFEWIYTEINEDPLYEGCALLPELAAWLADRGFALAEKRLWGAQSRAASGMRWFGWGDALFVRA